MDRILVVTVNWLGDAVLTIPVFKAIKQKFPDCYLGVMAVGRVAEVFIGNPDIDEVIVFDEKSRQRSIWAKIKFIKYLKANRFDTVFFIQRSLTRVLVCYLAGIKSRIGFRRLKTAFILTQHVIPPLGLIHRQDYYFSLFEAADIKVSDSQFRFFIPEEAQRWVDEMINSVFVGNIPLIGINVAANWDLKRWPLEKFASLGDRLIKELNCQVVFIGAAKEKPLVRKVIENMEQPAEDFCGRTTLKELGALMKKMTLLISNDSGPAHLAAALGLSTLVLFGPTLETITAPRGKTVAIIRKYTGCRLPCYNLDCRDNICMKLIGVEEVYSRAKQMIGK